MTSIPTRTPTMMPELPPFRLEQVGQLGGAANMLAHNGDMVYLQVGPRLATVDISNPVDPTIIGRSDVLPRGIKALAAQDEYALVEDGEGTVWLFETPASGDPQPIRSFSGDDPQRPHFPSLPLNAVQVGDYRFELEEEWWTQEMFLYVYKEDILITTALPHLPTGEIAASTSLVVHGQHAYAAIRDGLRIFDLSVAPERIVIFENDPDDQGSSIFRWQANSLFTDVGTLGHGCCLGYYVPELCMIEDKLYLGNNWGLADPENPVQEDWQLHQPDCNSFLVNNGWILSGSPANATYRLLDVSDSAHPIIRDISTEAERGEIKAVSRDLLFYYVGGANGEVSGAELLIFDIADPQHPRLLGSYSTLDSNPHHTLIDVLGRYVYIRTSGGPDPQQIVLDLSDPSNPMEVEAPNPSFFDAAEIIVSESIAYVLMDNQLDIYSTDDLSTPLATLNISLANDNDMWYSGGRLIVDASVLSILDVSDPAHPKVLAAAVLSAYQAAMYGDYLYLHQLEDGLAIYKLVAN